MPSSRYLSLDSSGNQYEDKAAATSTDVPAGGAVVMADGTTKVIDISLLPSGLGVETVTAAASEALSAGDLINIWSNAGTLNIRKADRNGKPAHGFVKAAFANAANATAFVDAGAVMSALTGLTPGSIYFLGTAGAMTTTPPAAASGLILQRVAYATTANAAIFEKYEPVVRTN